MQIHFHIFNILSILLPARCYKFKALLLGFCGAHIGVNVCLNAAIKCYSTYIEIGDSSWIGSETLFSTGPTGKVIIGSQCDIGPGVSFICGSHEIGTSTRRAGKGFLKNIIIGNGCWIGTRALILGGATLGNGTIVGAGSVVLSGEYPDNVLLCGVPAVIKKQLPNCDI